MKIFIIILLIISIFASFIFWFVFTYQILEISRRKKLGKNSIQANLKQISTTINSNTSFHWLMRNGINILNDPCRFILKKWKFLEKNLNVLLFELKNKNISASNETILSTIIGISFLIFVFSLITFRSIIAGITITLCLNILVLLIIKSNIDKRKRETRNLIPDTLRSMNICIKTGYTILQTFEQISTESKGGIQRIFKKATHILKTGGTIQDSLIPLKETKEYSELSFIAVALEVQHQTGGSMNYVIESAKDMAESKIKLLQMMHVQTAQAKLSSRIVIIMPFALIAIFSIISPNFLQPFFSSIIGFIFFCVACIMQIAGIFIVKKTLNFSEE